MSQIAKRGAELASINFNANRPWRILLPPVYRYLPGKYVDAFFETGQLMLSSFSRFKRHEDEARGDKDEGRSMVLSQGAGRQFGAFVVGGQDAYVLCGSFILSKAIIEKFDGCDAAIEITDVPQFALAVARQLPGFISGLSGYCIYADSRILARQVDRDPFPLPQDPNEQIPIGRILEATHDAALEEDLFLKQQQYSYQAEYRMIWNMDKEPLPFCIINSMEATQFCRRVSPEEIV
jgi:hypothetical protein